VSTEKFKSSLSLIMENIIITKATGDDLEVLKTIGKLTFFETFSLENTEDNMQKYLDEEFAHEKLKEQLEDRNSEFYFASIDKKIIGYLKLNFAGSQTELKDNNAIEIERIYVLKDYHGKNAGQLLYNKAIEIAMLSGVDYVWLGVWEKNLRAIQFYKKNGLVEFDKHIFMLGEDKQIDIMMKLQLNAKKEI
jgi:diamine N-acetyltransferase